MHQCPWCNIYQTEVFPVTSSEFNTYLVRILNFEVLIIYLRMYF